MLGKQLNPVREPRVGGEETAFLWHESTVIRTSLGHGENGDTLSFSTSFIGGSERRARVAKTVKGRLPFVAINGNRSDAQDKRLDRLSNDVSELRKLTVGISERISRSEGEIDVIRDQLRIADKPSP